MAAAITDLFRKGMSGFVSALSAGITSSDATIGVDDLSGYPDGTAITLTIDRVDANGVATTNPTKTERVTGIISGNNLTSCLRGQDGTTAQAHSSGAVIEDVWDADRWNDMVDGIIAEHNQDGTHSIIDYTAIKQNLVTSSDGATVTFNLNTSNIFSVTLGGNRTLALSNATIGQCFVIRLVQDGGGSRTVTWFDTISWSGGVAPTLTTTASKTDVFGFICTGTDTYDGFVIGQNL